MVRLRGRDALPIAAACGLAGEVEAVRRWYEPHLKRIHDDAPARKADLMQRDAYRPCSSSASVPCDHRPANAGPSR
jgi:hypothetical protein